MSLAQATEDSPIRLTAHGATQRAATWPILSVFAFAALIPVSAHFNSAALLVASMVLSLLVLLFTVISGWITGAQGAVALMAVSFVTPSSGVNLSPADFALLVLLMHRFAAYLRFGPRGRLVRAPSSITIYAWGVLTVVLAGALVAAVGGVLEPRLAVLAALKLAICLGYLSLFGMLTDSERHGCVDAWAITAPAAGLVAVIGVVLLARGIDVGLTTYYRATGTLNDPNALATYLLLSSSIVMLRTWTVRGRAYSASLLVIVIATVLTGSRASAVSAAVALALALLCSFPSAAARRLWWGALIPGIAVGAPVLFILLGHGPGAEALTRLQSVTDIGLTTSNVRFQLWDTAVSLWAAHPVIGVGFGQFQIWSGEGVGSPFGAVAHNTYLSVLAEVGLVGLTAILWYPVAILIRILMRAKEAGTSLLLFGFMTLAVMGASLNLLNFRPGWVFIGLAAWWVTPGRRPVPRRRT